MLKRKEVIFPLKNVKLKTLLELFATFFKIGAFTFGGGYAMIPIIQAETVEKKKWITDDDVLNIIAIAESTPGPIAINSATFVGYRVGGVLGSAFATFGMVLPSFIIISLLTLVIGAFRENRTVSYAFFGIRAGVLALVLKAWYTMYKKCPKDVLSYVIAALAFIAVTVFNISVIYVVIGCAVIGLVSAIIADRRVKK